jgi:hypothetical protein
MQENQFLPICLRLRCFGSANKLERICREKEPFLSCAIWLFYEKNTTAFDFFRI